MWQRDARFAITRPAPIGPDLPILLIEDHEPSRRLAHGMLSAIGVRHVIEAENGKAGIAALGQRAFALVICDWMMPEVTGLDVLKVVRKTRPGLPFIMLTALNDMAMVNAAKEAGVSAYLVKPISFNDLRAKVSGVLRKSEGAIGSASGRADPSGAPGPDEGGP